MYLAERESLRVYGEPISGDKPVSMPHGPVLSRTYDLMNGWGSQAQDGWNSWVEDRSGYDLALRDPSMIRSPELDLLELSDGDLEILESVWSQFGHLGKYDLVEYTHSSACPEWEDPRGSSRPIPPVRLLRAVGYEGDALQSALEHLSERARLNAALG
ncbi:Panacea domain-containing protein [Pusillimonas sp.]|uniref:Panacea domain-containing protein n=1 Tax=Pusillimonas sp. TaxID=3040095 RepID=UPI0039B87111